MSEITQLLTGKVALITGGASGVGAETSRLFVAHGATVFITDTLTQEEGQQLAQELGARASYIYLDAGDAGSWRVVIDAIEEDHGGLDVFVYNSGSMHVAHAESMSIENTSIEDYISMLNIGLLGNFLGIRSVLPQMKNRSDASIVNIVSLGAHGVAARPSSKSEICNLNRIAADELGRYGIRVNSVHHRGLASSQPNKGMSNNSDDLNDSKRGTAATEVANTVLFLSSKLCGHSTAGEYVVQGNVINQHLYGVPSLPSAYG